MNRPGSFEAFLELFAPEDYLRLVAYPGDCRRRARITAVSVLAVLLLAACCWALAVSALTPARHATVARQHHHRPAVVAHRGADRDESLGPVV